MKYDRLLKDFTRAIIVLALMAAILGVADELTLMRSHLFDIKRMLSQHMMGSMLAERARSADAPTPAPSSKETAHAEVSESHEGRDVGQPVYLRGGDDSGAGASAGVP